MVCNEFFYTRTIQELNDEKLSAKNSKLKPEILEEWKTCFDCITLENSELREVLSHSRADISKMNVEIMRLNKELIEVRSLGGDNKRGGSLYGAALSGINLDPFRLELIRQFGSFESAFSSFNLSPKKGVKIRITLNEVELLAISLGYSRDYSTKLFYALDTRNRGVLSIEQFSRPLPVLVEELCLLTKASS